MAEAVSNNNFTLNEQSGAVHAPVNSTLVNSEAGESTELVDFLNAESQELKLDFDINDLLAQNSSTKYCLPGEINSSPHFTPINDLFLLHVNIRSLNKNFDQFHFLINELKLNYGVIGLCETWLNDISPASLFQIDDFTLVTKDRVGKRGGGVGFYVSNSLKFNLLDDYCITSDVIESIFIEIEVPNKRNVIIAEIYRPPHSIYAEFIETLHDILSTNHLNDKTCIIMGDFNHNLLNYRENHTCQDFLDLMLSKSYIPLIRKPTRLSNTASTLI